MKRPMRRINADTKHPPRKILSKPLRFNNTAYNNPPNPYTDVRKNHPTSKNLRNSFYQSHFYRSSGVNPVFLAILANIRGPISSRSWNEKTKSDQPSRLRVRWDPVCRTTNHPFLCSARRTSGDFLDGHWLIRHETGYEFPGPLLPAPIVRPRLSVPKFLRYEWPLPLLFHRP